MSAHDEHEDDTAETPPDNMQGEPPLAASEDGERRRRRRGRRGGRRNRRENEGEARPAADPQVESGWQDWAEHPQSDAIEPPVATAQPAEAIAPEASSWRSEGAQGFEQPSRSEPAAEPPARPAPVVTPIETTPEVEQVPVRRRSTIREPAPVVGGAFDSAATATTASPPDPVPEITSATASENEAAPAENKPRRAGWWSRKILGKD
jgi:ribonuclease E